MGTTGLVVGSRFVDRLVAFGAATTRNLAAPDRLSRLRAAARCWVALDRSGAEANASPIAAMYLSQLWPDVGHLRADTTMDIGHWWELPYGERAVVDALVRLVQPNVSFEFGTFSGSTTALIAAASPRSSVVHTIDVPEDMIDEAYRELGVTPDMIGARLDEVDGDGDGDGDGGSIRFHRQMIEDFDFAPLRAAVQFVLVDASHDYESVRDDSRRALEMVAADGVVVWDDYLVGAHPGVTRALDELAAEVPLAHIATTRLVVHGRGRFAFADPALAT